MAQNVIGYSMMGWLLHRFGLLSAMIALCSNYYWAVPPSQWYVGRGIYPALLFVVPAAWALWVILAAKGRRAASADSAE